MQARITKEYIVAGHRFAFSTEQEDSVWKVIPNYLPFMADDSIPAELIFSVEINRPGILNRPTDARPVYVGITEPEEPRIDMYSVMDGWWAELAPVSSMPPVATLRINNDFSHGIITYTDNSMARFAVDSAAMLLFAFSTANLNTLEMHSSVVTKDGRAYMFLAKSGTGKSTHSRMWLENISGTELLNDDNPIVRIFEDGSTKVFGSPWSGKTPCYKNKSAELGAMVLIRRCSENRISQPSLPEMYAIILSSSSGFRSIGNMADGLHNSISTIALTGRCYILDCRPDAQAAEICSKEVCR